MPGEEQGAWITAIVAIVSLATTTIVQLVLRSRDKRHERQNDVLRLRREALHKALGVIDHVYANVSGFGQDPHRWDIMEARDAWNMMLLYCERPRAATDAFALAIGLKNEKLEGPTIIEAASFTAFRRVVARELGNTAMETPSPDYVWIKSLPGAVPPT